MSYVTNEKVSKLFTRLQAELDKLFRYVNMQRRPKIILKAPLLVGNENTSF